MQKCKFLSKSLNGFIRCKLSKQQVTSLCYKNCSNFILTKNKGIKKVSSKRIYTTKETYQKVFKRDKGRCKLCGRSENLQLHHIHGRGKELTNDIDNCVMLCMNCHLNVVHKNQKKYRPLLEELIKENK